MKNKKTALTLILIMVMAVTACAQQYDPESDFRAVESPDEDYAGQVLITAYLGNKKVVRIPPRIRNMPVIAIMENTFKGKQLTSVTIPNSVIGIEEHAFANNLLTSITIPNNVTFLCGFENNKLTSVTIPNSVTWIGEKVFANNQLTSVTIPNSVKVIAGGAFADNKLTSITIPNSVTEISSDAFANNPLTSITIPSNVSFFGNPFPGDFADVYEKNGMAGGTYRADANGNWRKE